MVDLIIVGVILFFALLAFLGSFMGNILYWFFEIALVLAALAFGALVADSYTNVLGEYNPIKMPDFISKIGFFNPFLSFFGNSEKNLIIFVLLLAMCAIISYTVVKVIVSAVRWGMQPSLMDGPAAGLRYAVKGFNFILGAALGATLVLVTVMALSFVYPQLPAGFAQQLAGSGIVKGFSAFTYSLFGSFLPLTLIV